jgi:phosphoserine phosphatase
MIVVFDFDRTLTYRDTLLGFYVACSRKDAARFIKLAFYLILMAAHKFKVVSNHRLKQCGVHLFLKGKSKEFINECAEVYSGKISLNMVHATEFGKYKKPYVISASFAEYLKPLFPEATIICSEIEFNNNNVKCLKKNCHGVAKYQIVSDMGIRHIDKLYTDSASDLPLARISGEIYLVKGDRIIKCQNLQDFIRLTA